jgi:hypothetical protein
VKPLTLSLYDCSQRLRVVTPETFSPKRNYRSILNFSADEISFWKWQEYAVYSRIVLRTVQELRLDAGGSYVVDDEPSTGHEARDDLLVDLSVELRRLNIGETKRDLLEASRIVESIAVKDLDRISRSGAGNVLAGQSNFLFIEIDRGERDAFCASSQR